MAALIISTPFWADCSAGWNAPATSAPRPASFLTLLSSGAVISVATDCNCRILSEAALKSDFPRASIRAGSLPRTVPASSAFLITAFSSPRSASTPTFTLMACASFRSSLPACRSAAVSCFSSSLTSAVAPLAFAFSSFAVSLSTSFCALSILDVKSSVDTDIFAFLVSRDSIFFEIASIWRLTLWSSRSSPRMRIALASSLARRLVSSSMSEIIFSRPEDPPPCADACFRSAARPAVAVASLAVSLSIAAVSTPTAIDPPAALAALT